VGACFVVFAKELRGNRAEQNICFLKLSMGEPGVVVISVNGAVKNVDCGLGEGGGLGAV